MGVEQLELNYDFFSSNLHNFFNSVLVNTVESRIQIILIPMC